MTSAELLEQAKGGFSSVKMKESFKENALQNLEQWLTDPQFVEYVPQIEHLIKREYWDYLLDSFYQVIPFGTGGRRGEVGIGPNRINPWTIKSSAQGHSQYLIKKYGDEAKRRGIVLAYDVRQFFTNKYFNDVLPNPVRNLNGQVLVKAAAEVYAGNGIHVFIFDSFRTTPELSFAVRFLQAVSGDMFSASHNPPEHNGKKVYDEFGGQLIPPHDEELVEEVTVNVQPIKEVPFAEAEKAGLTQMIGTQVDEAYVEACCQLSLSTARDLSIVYTPLHGCGSTSVLKVLQKLGFTVQTDPETSNPSGNFEHVTFNIPNPEVIQSFETPLKFAQQINADIILSSDPDADRIGVMINTTEGWKFVNGNEIGGMLTRYVVNKKVATLKGQGIVIKTDVTTNLITEICKKHNVRIIGDLLVGFKFIGEEMNKLETAGQMDNFLMGCEESHGYTAGNYLREKDAVPPAIWLAELAAELKLEGRTLIDYLNETYSKYGYFRNFLTEIRLPGAEGMSQIQQIQTGLRENAPQQFGSFVVESMEDWGSRLPLVSETDKVAKNGLVFHFKPVDGTTSIRVTVRPSGTEPKIKMYYEIGSLPFELADIENIKHNIETLLKQLEKDFMKTSYKLIGIDFPDRGFLLFWQLPLKDKLHYFEVEPEIEKLKELSTVEEKQQRLTALLAFLGSDPLKKVNDAFSAKNGVPIEQYLGLS